MRILKTTLARLHNHSVDYAKWGESYDAILIRLLGYWDSNHVHKSDIIEDKKEDK